MTSFEISWFGPHFGEEPPISGPPAGGSGTIFFCRCNLKCVYCQNWQISQERISCETVSTSVSLSVNEVELLKMMFELQEKGCRNVNLVSPTIWASGLREVLKTAKKKGLKIPILWNSNAYETVKSLQKLEGLVDIYLPDYKYSQEELAIKYSSCPGYPKIASSAILEMQRQVGDLQVDSRGIAQRGLIVRHLVLPGHLENTRKSLKFIRSISDQVYLSLMSQYNPTYRAKEFPEINRVLKKEEYEQVLKMVKDLDFKYGWIQEFGGAVKCLSPDFCQENPFN
jgi:putative pyruvate formate lyase activating enzyme